MVCYLTSKSNIVAVSIFEIFAAKITDLDLERFKVIQVVSIDIARVDSYSNTIDTIIVSFNI